jgi:hypothetical protein
MSAEQTAIRKILFPSALAPMTKDGFIDQPNVDAVILRNAGDATVNLWGGAYTLDCKETLSINVTEFIASLQLQSIPVTFDTTTGSVKKLQIILLKAVAC